MCWLHETTASIRFTGLLSSSLSLTSFKGFDLVVGTWTHKFDRVHRRRQLATSLLSYLDLLISEAIDGVDHLHLLI